MPSTATLATGAVTNFMAVALDSLGNMVAGTPTWTVVAGGGSITSGGTFTAGSTAGTFTNTVQASISGVSGFATVIVQPGAVTRVTVAPMSVTLAPNGTTTFTAQALDANNNVVTAAVTWSATAASGAINPGGVFTAGTSSGNFPAAVTATVNGVSGTANVSINAGALAQLTITPSVATTQAGGTVGFTATGRDGNNNTVAVTPVWSVVSGGGTISPAGVFSAGTMTGTFANTVRAESNGVTSFATVTVSPGPLARLELTPSSATLDPGATQQFTGVGKDAFGNAVSASITWTSNANAGSITAGGLFTAGTLAGDYLDGVTAAAGNVTATASIRVGIPMVVDGGIDAGMMEVDGGTDAGMTVSDAGMNEQPDAGPLVMPDGGSGTISGKSGCGCGEVDAMVPLLGLVVLALRRRRPSGPMKKGSTE